MTTVKPNWILIPIIYFCIDGAINENTLSVVNFNRIQTGDGDYDMIEGEAYTTGEPGKLKVQLDGVPVEADCRPRFSYNYDLLPYYYIYK